MLPGDVFKLYPNRESGIWVCEFTRAGVHIENVSCGDRPMGQGLETPHPPTPFERGANGLMHLLREQRLAPWVTNMSWRKDMSAPNEAGYWQEYILKRLQDLVRVYTRQSDPRMLNTEYREALFTRVACVRGLVMHLQDASRV